MLPVPINETNPTIDRLIDEHRSQLYGFVLSLVANNSDAEDLLQQVCLILWDKRDQFEPGSNFLAWARKIARFEALNHWRKEKNRPQQPLLDEHLLQVIHERSEERELEFARHRRALQLCIAQLSERHREVIEAHYFEEKSIPKIAETLGLKANAVSQLLFRARSGLTACVQSRTLGTTEEDH
ncbi:sigma-70 family RNA polymerase sigma factor [Verrucomicrobiales bacterium]|nr:sigma-70 family RNA polymerase sigma factor [Verrucomicrobiales bacterium]MDC0275647.1 sigma-70 family RNA polymerase sigma factor [Verrucomicrobiales bacterium]MDC0321983.1 sigma-70 family RNA polymerase sigma factor [Verrucomicrobiales bacterium]